jgi:hypothetical protein
LQVSGVAFDLHWSSPTSDGTEENLVYRFGSVGQVFAFPHSLLSQKKTPITSHDLTNKTM